MESLAQLEVLCEKLYNSQDSAERAHAETTLKCFSTNIDYILQCQYILDNASSSYALIMASSSLLKQVTDHSLPLQLRLEICNILYFLIRNKSLHNIFVTRRYLCSCLASILGEAEILHLFSVVHMEGEKLEPFVIGSLIQLFCRVTKLGWLDDDRFREVDSKLLESVASSSDSWMREFNEASKLADEVNGMISGRSSLPPSGQETQCHMATAHRKATY